MLQKVAGESTKSYIFYFWGAYEGWRLWEPYEGWGAYEGAGLWEPYEGWRPGPFRG